MIRIKSDRITKTGVFSAVLLVLVLLLTACGQEKAPQTKSDDGTETDKEISIGSKIDTEGALLGNMIALLLEEEGFTVIDRIQTGSTPVVREAIISGEIDIYPEYTGNGFFFFSGKSEAGIWKDAEAGWEAVSKLDLEENNIVWLSPAPANNTWAIALRRDMAEAEGLATLEDLAAYINRGGTFKLAGSEEFVSSEAALPAFEEGYGFSLEKDQLLVLAGGNTTLTEKAAATGQDGVNAAMAYGTDGQLAALDLVVMEDTLGIQPVYAPTPIIRKEVLDTYPQIRELLKPLFDSLDLSTLQELNGRIGVSGEDPQAVAEEYLKTMQFIR